MKKMLTTALMFLMHQAQSQVAVISTTETRVLYQWIENALDIAVANTDCKNIVVKAESGTITGENCSYKYSVASDGVRIDRISVGIKKNGKIKWLTTETLPVKKLPDPIVFVGTSAGGNIAKNAFIAQSGVRLYSSCFDISLMSYYGRTKIVKWKLSVKRNGKEIFADTTHTNVFFNEATRAFFDKQLTKGDEVIFYDFSFLIFDKELRKTDQEMKFNITD